MHQQVATNRYFRVRGDSQQDSEEPISPFLVRRLPARISNGIEDAGGAEGPRDPFAESSEGVEALREPLPPPGRLVVSDTDVVGFFREASRLFPPSGPCPRKRAELAQGEQPQ